MITYREALTRAADQLSQHPESRPTALADAALLLMHLLGLERATLIAHPERTLDREQQREYQGLIERRLRFEPVQYITGVQEFYGLPLRVGPGVLIPRPETELLVEAVLARVESAARIVDVGTGSGAIALALKQELPHAEVTGLDLSTAALEIAAANAAALSLRVRLQQSDLLAGVEGEQFDCVVSNPPYIPTGDAPGLATQVREFEPAEALFAGTTGLEVYRRLIPQAEAVLKPDGVLAMEIGFGQRDALAGLLTAWTDVAFIDDLQGIPRVVVAQRSSAGRSRREEG